MCDKPVNTHITLKNNIAPNKTNRYVCTSFAVDSVHVLMKLWPMVISVSVIVRHKKKSVYHLVLEKV